MKKKTDWNKIAQHVEAGDSGEVDKQALEDSQFIWQKSAELGKKLQDHSYKPNVEAGMAKMYARIHKGDEVKETATIVPLKKNYFMRYAAAAAIVFMLSYVVFKNLPANTEQLTANQEVKNNTTDSPQQLSLIDGTQVTLAAGAALIYPTDFTADTRTVQLKGAAFFDVKRDESKPFIITTETANVQVLGTSFNLDAQGDRVALEVKTGKVAFSNKQKDKLLYVTANQDAVYDIAADQLIKTRDGASIKWGDDRIRLTGETTVWEVTELLAFRDQITFTFEEESLKELTVAGSIKPTDDASDVLKNLFKTHQELQYQKEGQEIHIKRRN